MLLPKNERRDLTKITKKVLWIYGKPFSGKTWFANRFPDPLMLNTDGNIKYVDSPFISIRDEVTSSGRMTTTKLGWEVFKDVIDELAKKQNEFKTIIVDLLEDTYEMCRLYMYKEMGITHESDDSFRAWDKVRTEFLSTMRKLVNLDYENIILISHDLGVIAQLCDHVLVMYAGQVIERGSVQEIFHHPAHPYTQGLLASLPRVDADKDTELAVIDGQPPDLLYDIKGCPFVDRCPHAMQICAMQPPEETAIAGGDTHAAKCWLQQKKEALN